MIALARANSGRYSRILVGYDGSDNAQRALEAAVGIAKRLHGELRIMLAVNLAGMMSMQGVSYDEVLVDNVMNSARALVDMAVQQAKRSGVESAEGFVEEGPAAATLLGEAKDFRADLLVVGRRGTTGFKRLLMGSVSSAAVTHSECDVLVVK